MSGPSALGGVFFSDEERAHGQACEYAHEDGIEDQGQNGGGHKTAGLIDEKVDKRGTDYNGHDDSAPGDPPPDEATQRQQKNAQEGQYRKNFPRDVDGKQVVGHIRVQHNKERDQYQVRDNDVPVGEGTVSFFCLYRMNDIDTRGDMLRDGGQREDTEKYAE